MLAKAIGDPVWLSAIRFGARAMVACTGRDQAAGMGWGVGVRGGQWRGGGSDGHDRHTHQAVSHFVCGLYRKTANNVKHRHRLFSRPLITLPRSVDT